MPTPKRRAITAQLLRAREIEHARARRMGSFICRDNGCGGVGIHPHHAKLTEPPQMIHHTEDVFCPACEDKLKQAHPKLGTWFHFYKAKYPNLHISWSFRGEADQEQAFLDGKSKLHWPDSKHNHTVSNCPQSLALDLFQIDEDGVGRWSPVFFTQLYSDVVSNRDPILWGGKFRELGDLDHFQLIEAST